MKTAVSICLCLLLLAVSTAVLMVAVPLHDTLVQSKEQIAGIGALSGQIRTTIADMDTAVNGKHGVRQLLYNLDLATAQSARTMTTIQIASKEEHQKALEASAAAVSAIQSLDKLIGDTRTQLDGAALPALAETLRSTSSTLDALRSSDGVLVQSSAAMKNAAALIGDPHIPSILAHVDGTMTNVQEGTGHLSGILGYVQHDMDPNKPKPTFKQVLLSKGMNALPGLLEGWFLRAIIKDHEVVDVNSLPVSTGRR